MTDESRFYGDNDSKCDLPPMISNMVNMELMNDLLTNMKLAHEISVNPDFKLLSHKKNNESSFYDKVKTTMKTAFWDIHASKLNQDPPDYSSMLELLTELKAKISTLLPPNALKYKTDFAEKFDLDLIKNQVLNNTLNLNDYYKYLIKILGELCAPARDCEIKMLTETKEPIAFFKKVFDITDNMMLDMANYTLTEIRPYVEYQSCVYERVKFVEYLKLLQEAAINGILPDDGKDGLLLTKKWLINASNSIINEFPQSVNEDADVRFKMVLNRGYLMQLANSILPETFAMDRERIINLSNQKNWIVIVSTLISITMASPIAQAKVERLNMDRGGDNSEYLRVCLVQNMALIVTPNELAMNKRDCSLRLIDYLLREVGAVMADNLKPKMKTGRNSFSSSQGTTRSSVSSSAGEQSFNDALPPLLIRAIVPTPATPAVALTNTSTTATTNTITTSPTPAINTTAPTTNTTANTSTSTTHNPTPSPAEYQRLLEDSASLRDQLMRVNIEDRHFLVCKLFSDRMDAYILDAMHSKSIVKNPIPKGFSCLQIQFNAVVRVFLKLTSHNHMIHRELYRDLYDLYITGGFKLSRRYAYERLQRNNLDPATLRKSGGRGVGSKWQNPDGLSTQGPDEDAAGQDDASKTSDTSQEGKQNGVDHNPAHKDNADPKVDEGNAKNAKKSSKTKDGDQRNKLKANSPGKFPDDLSRLPGSFGYVPDYTRRGTIGGAIVKTAFGRAALTEDKTAAGGGAGGGGVGASGAGAGGKNAPGAAGGAAGTSRHVTPKTSPNAAVPRYAEKTAASSSKATRKNSSRSPRGSPRSNSMGKYANRDDATSCESSMDAREDCDTQNLKKNNYEDSSSDSTGYQE